ncbi:MAG: AIR synthase related protein, partial [Thermoplasmatota archaeon]
MAAARKKGSRGRPAKGHAARQRPAPVRRTPSKGVPPRASAAGRATAKGGGAKSRGSTKAKKAPTRTRPKRTSRSPPRARRTIHKPAVHEPAPLPVAPPPFEVHMDKGARGQPLDPVTGRTPLTYAASGVDIESEDKAVAAITSSPLFRRSGFGAPLGAIGHFAGMVEFGPENALVLCTDGVGSKVEIAQALRKWDTVGIDCMAMNVNDCLCVGAEPLAFVDYLALETPDAELARQIGVGLDEGCRQSNCTLVGGETASLPGIVKGFDLAGTCLGFVRRSAIVDGSKIQPGDVLIGLASSG